MRLQSRVLVCLALSSVAHAFREGAYRDLACQQAMSWLRVCQEGLLPAAETEAQCCIPFRALNNLQCLCPGRENLYQMLNLATVANLRQCGESSPARSVASSCALNMDVQAERTRVDAQDDGGVSLDLDVDIQLGEDASLQDGDQDASAMEPQPAITLSLAGSQRTGWAVEQEEAPLDVVVDVVLGLGRGESRSTSSVIVGENGGGIDAQLDLMYDGESADMSTAMNKVAAWLTSLMPVLTGQREGRPGDRMDDVEQLGGMLNTVGNVLSVVGGMLAKSLQESSNPGEIDITYDIDVEVDPRSSEYEAEIDIDVNSSVGLLSSASMRNQLQEMTSFLSKIGSQGAAQDAQAAQPADVVTQMDVDTQIRQVEMSVPCASLWCSISQWVCANQDTLMQAIQVELALVALALLGTLLWTVSSTLLSHYSATTSQDDLLEPLTAKYDGIERAAEYVDAGTDAISPLWAVMDKSRPVDLSACPIGTFKGMHGP
eukprot:jgi/Botrbrau1/23560/Bobra.0141s0030.2